MASTAPVARGWIRRTALVLGTIGSLAILLAILVHSAPFRIAVLRQATRMVEERLGLTVVAATLDYDLFRLRIKLSGVTVAAAHAPREPFLAADRIDVELPVSSLRGRFGLDRLDADNVRVSIRWSADGDSNLPRGRGDSPGDPGALVVGRIEIPRLAVTLVDEASRLTLDLPALAVDVGGGSGRLNLVEPGRLRGQSRETVITRLGGPLEFDGRTVRLGGLALSTSELDLSIEGALRLLAAAPAADLRFAGSGDLEGLARWGTDAATPRGRLDVRGSLAGPLASLRADLEVGSRAFDYGEFTSTDLEAAFTVDARRLEVRRVELRLAGGVVTGSGGLAFGPGGGAFDATWRDVSLGAVVGPFAPRGAPAIAARTTGSIRLEGPGTSPGEWSVDVRARLRAPSNAAGLGVSGEARLTAGAGRWRFTGDHAVAGALVRATAGGALDPSQLGSSSLSGTVAIDSADVPRSIAILNAAGLLDIPADAVAAGRVSLRAGLAGSVAAPRFMARAEARDLVAAGITRLAADVDARGTTRRVDVEASLTHGSANSATFSGSVSVPDRRVTGRMTSRLAEPGALARDVPIAGLIEMRAEGEGSFDAFVARATIAADDLRYADLRLGTLAASLALDGDTLHLDSSLPELGARVTAEIGRLAPYTSRVDLRMENAPIERLLSAATLPAPITGVLSLMAGGEGPLDDWRQGHGTVTVSALTATSGDLSFRLDRPAEAAYEAGTIAVATLDGVLGDLRLSVAGRYPAIDGAPEISPADQLHATLTGDVGQAMNLLRVAGPLPAAAGAEARGPFVLLARVARAASGPLVSAALELGPAELKSPGLPVVRGVSIRARLDEGWAELDEAVAEWQGARLHVEGRTPQRVLRAYLPASVAAWLPAVPGMAAVAARVTGVSPRVLEPFVDPATVAQIEGTVDGSIALQTPALTAEGLRGAARLDRLELRVAGLPLTQREPTRIDIVDGTARVGAWEWTGPGTNLIVQGEVRLAERRAALLAGGGLDLRLLTPFAGAGVSLSGTVEPRLSISGPLDDLRFDGALRLVAGGLRLRDPAVVATDLTADVGLSPRRASITGLNGVVNGGALNGSGELTYGSDGVQGRLGAVIVGMGLAFPEGLRSELNADVTLTIAGTPARSAGEITGTVTVVRSDYREPLAVVTTLLSTLRTSRLRAPQGPPSFTDRLALNVRVVTDDDLSVDNNLARLRLGGDLRVIGTVAAPGLSGRATLRDGGQLFLGRNRYTIESGTIDFANPAAIEPHLTVQARTRAGGEQIELTLTGTPDNLDVDLRSDSAPELGQADLASLLLTGRHLDALPGAEARVVGEQVVGYLSGDLFGAASRVVGLDTIRLGGVDSTRRDPAAVASEADPTSRLTFAKNLGESLEVTFSQSLREGGAQTWILDYTPVPYIGLRLVNDDESLRSYEFRHDISFGQPSSAQRARAVPAPEVRVAAVALTGDVADRETRLRGVLGLNAGDRFDFLAWQRDRDRLEAALRDEGRFEARVSARREEADGSVELVYIIDAGPPTNIVVSGYELPPAARRAIEVSWANAIVDDFLLEEVRSAVSGVLAAAGHSRAVVSPTIESDVPSGARTLAITIEPGLRTTERRVTFVTAGDEGLGLDLSLWARARGLEEQAWREPSSFERALVAELRSRGHARARVAVEAPADDGSISTVRVRVDAGPVVTVGEVRFAGAESLAPDRLIEEAALPAGGLFDPSEVDRARERVVRAHRAEGFADARVVAEVRPGAGGPDAVLVEFTIDQGPRQVLREIVVEGNRSIDTGVVTRAVGLEAGAPLAGDAWLDARSRLFDTALFRRVDVIAEPTEDAASIIERPMRLRAVVEEWPAVRLRYGIQVSEERPEGEVEGRDLATGLAADVTRRTLFGRAVTVGAAGELQPRQRLARLFVNAPTTFGRRIESLATIQRSREKIGDASLVTDGVRLSWEQRVRLGPAFRVSYTMGLERNRTFESEAPPDPLDPPFDVSIAIARLTGAAVFDTRDDPLDATRGWLLSSNLEYAPSSFGSDIRFLRHLGQAYRFQQVGRVVLASAARVGLAAPQGGQFLIPSERYFGGGARTVRGVAENGLGPRDLFGDAAGGGALVVFNQEARVPVHKWIRAVVFVDAGNVFESPSRVDLGSLVGSFGAGVRVPTPFALLRADVARLWSPRPDEPAVRWTFGIGQSF